MSDSTNASASATDANGMIEGLAGIGIAVLAILGLAGLADDWLAAVAVAVTGVALVALGASVVAHFAEAGAGAGGGIGVEILGGMVAVILGILALLDVS